MEQHLHNPSAYDYRRYDQVWQRVAPQLEPYPGFSGPAVPALADLPAAMAQPAGTAARSGAMTAGSAVAAEEQLPGAQENPCCMGSAAAEMTEVLTGFIEGELADRRYYQAFARQAPAWARQRLRQLAEEAGAHARRLMAVYYLITGGCYQAAISCERIYVGHWCAALRERYHVEACSALNYVRAAEGTTDPCLTRLLGELSADEYRQADLLLGMLERAMQPGG